VNLELAGERALIIGGARGLGRAIADGFREEGCEIILIDRASEVLTTATQLGGVGFQADVIDYPQVLAVIQQLPPVQHVVYAAGIGSGKFGFPFWNLAPSDWGKVLQVNLLGAVNVAHAIAPKLAEQRRGTMLFLASVAGQIGSQTDPPYSAAKAGLINFGQCAAKDLAPFGVRLNILNPGMVKTDLNRSVWQAWHDQQPAELRKNYDDWTAEKIQKIVPLNRWQTPEDIAAMAVFLASARAGNVTGQTINVDGGYVMHW
jgi:2-hydroxycyclohexanecarboxyl-CoA dehydrogenase